MGKKKTIIWFLGSNASGKTSQSSELHKYYGNGPKKINKWKEQGENVKYTTFGSNIGHVGEFGENQCTGTDTINSKKSLEMSLIYCLNECDIVVVDGIMATSTWLDIFNQFPETVSVKVILLQFNNIEENLRRVAERRACKIIDDGGNDGADIYDFEMFVDEELRKIHNNDKTIKNISSKFKGFENMFNKVRINCLDSIKIDASKDFLEISTEILNFLHKVK